MSGKQPPRSPLDTRASKKVKDYIEAARQHHARTGEWPPDPLLDEVAEMRRQILAEHDNDYGKVLDWYVELGKQRTKERTAGEQTIATSGGSPFRAS